MKIFEVQGIDEWNNLQKNIYENIPIVIHFYSDFYAPCVALKEPYMQLAERWKDKAFFVIVNIDKTQQLVDVFNIVTLPTVAIIHKKELISKIVGTSLARTESILHEIFNV